MKQTSSKEGINQIYTNHCVRTTTVTLFYQVEIDSQLTCSITIRKSEWAL